MADGFNMDDPAYGVSVADLSQKAACRCDGPHHWRQTDFSARSTQLSGVENELFVDPKTSMLSGDAKQSLINLGIEVKAT